MWFLIIIALGFCQQCPSVFYLSNIPQPTNLIAYSGDYNYLITSQQNSMLFLQAESGTLRQVKQTDGVSLSYLMTDGGNLYVGGKNELLIFSLDEQNSLIDSLSFSGTVTYIQVINTLISIGTNNYFSVLWDPINDLIIGRIESLMIKNIQSSYQILSQSIYQTILIGTTTTGMTQLEYYQNNMQYLAFTSQISTCSLIQIIAQSTSTTVTSTIYTANGQTLNIYTLKSDTTITLTQNSITLPYQVAQMQMQSNYLALFYSNCYYQTLDQAGTLGTLKQWSTNCPAINTLIFNIDDMLITLLLSNPTVGQEIIQIYQLDSSYTGTKIRSFYYLSDTISQSYILQSNYILEVMQSNNNIYVYNQWYQLQQTIIVNNQPTYALQIFQSDLILVLFNNGLVVQLQETSTTCQFTQFTCYTYAVQAQFQQQTVTTYTSQLISTFQYNNVIYAIYTLDKSLYVYSFVSNAFTLTNSQTLSNNIIQITISSNQIELLLDNNQQAYYSFNIATSIQTPAQTITYQLSSTTQMTENSNYQIITSGSSLQILKQSDKSVLKTISQTGVKFKQIQVYNTDKLIVLEQNSFNLYFFLISDLLKGTYSPVYTLQIQEYSIKFSLNQNSMIIQFSQYVMILLMNDFFQQNKNTQCTFSQTYGGSPGSFISTQMSLENIYILYQSLSQLQKIQGTITVQTQNLLWTQILINQKVNQYVLLTIKGTSPTASSVIIGNTITNFMQLNFKDITIILPQCILSLSNIQSSEINNCPLQYQTAQCIYFSLNTMTSFTLIHYIINGLTMMKTFIQSSQVSNIILNDIQISTSQLSELVTIDTSTKLTLKSFTIQQSSCNSQLTIKQLFQYYSLNINDAKFTSNTICNSIFSNIINDFAASITFDIINLNVISNTFTTQKNAAVLNQLSSNVVKTATINLKTITLQSNTYPQNDVTYSFSFARGVSLKIYSAQMDSSAIQILNYDKLNMTEITYQQPSQLCINVNEVPYIYIDQITFGTGTISHIGLIFINNQADYDCSQADTCIIRLLQVSLTQIKIISSDLANTCYAISVNVKSAFEIQLSQVSFYGVILQSSDQSFIVSATGIYVVGYQSELLLSACNFQSNAYSLSTSLLILNALVLTLNTVTVNSLIPLTTVYYGTQSEKGGIAQIVTSALYVAYCNFNDVTSYSGSVFIVELYHASNSNPTISFYRNNITNIFSFGSAAIYIEKVVDFTQIVIQGNQLGSIFSLGDGGLFYFQPDANSVHEKMNFNYITIINIDDIQPPNLNRTIQFIDNIFWNLYSTNGSLIVATAYNIQFYNNSFLFNNQSLVPYQLNATSFTQGSMLYLRYCVLNISNFTFNLISYSSSQTNEGLILYSFQTWIKMAMAQFTNIITKNSQMLYIDSSYLNIDALLISNISLQQSRLTSSLIEIYGSALYMTNPTISLSQCKVYSCTTAGLMIKNTYAYILGGFFSSNKGNFGGAMFISITKEFVVLDSAIFILNYANTFGGSICADLQNVSTLVISNTQFSSNTAQDSGGALYINSFNQSFNVSQTQDIAVVQIIDTTFTDNVAQKYGGAIKTQVFCPYYDNVNFTQNVAAIEGSNISAYPTSLFLAQPLYQESPNQYVYDVNLQPAKGYSFVPFSDSGQFLLDNFRSGDQISQGLQFLMKSSTNQTMYNDLSYLKIQPTGTDQYTVSITNPSRNTNEVKFSNGSFTLEGAIIIGTPSSSYQFFLNTDEIKSTQKYRYYYTNNYNYTFNVNFRSCLYGEILQDFDNQTICYQCPQGFYSFSLPTPSDPGQCQVCPLNSAYHIQCYGGAQTNLQPYYWRENVVNLQVYDCDIQLSSCTGGISDSQCGIGYMGRMCQACDYDNNYARDSRSQCIFCSTVNWPLAIILLSSIGIILYFAMSIFFLAQDVVILCVLPCLNQLLPPLKKIGSNLGQVKDLNSLMKIFLTYYQQISLVTKIITDIPTEIGTTTSSSPSMFDFSIECPLINLNNYIPMVYVNYIIEVMKPVSSMLFFMFIWTILFRKQHIKRGIYYTATWLIIWLFYLPSFYESTLQLLNCKTIGEGRYLKPDLNQDCYGTEHFFYTLFISIPCLLFFVVYVPVMLLYHIRNDMRKKDKRPLRKYKYYYINGEFREKFYYWEFVRLLEKLLIQTCVEIFFYDNIYMAESCLIIVLIYGVGSFVAQPYGYKRQNFVNVVSSFTAFGTIYIAMVIATLRNQFSDPYAPVIIFFEVLLAAINVVYTLWMSWKLFKVLLPVLFVNIEQIQRKVANIRFLRKLVLGERQRAKLLFQRIGQRVIVINLVRKHALMRYQQKELKEKQLLEIENKIRNRQQTAAQDALNYILRENGQELQEEQFAYVELPEYAKQNH